MSESNIIVVGLIASVIVWILKQLTRNGTTIPAAVLTTAVYIVSFVLAVVWVHAEFPSLPVYAGDPIAFASAVLAFIDSLLAVVGGYVAFAALIYQALVKRLLDEGVPMVVGKVRAAIAVRNE